MSIHLPLGGSTAARSLVCPAWISRSKKVKPRKAGSAADLGSLLHQAMENYYLHNQEFTTQIENKLSFLDIQLTEDHLPMLWEMVRAVEYTLDLYNIDEYMCEPFVTLVPGFAGGSVDMLGVSADGKTAIILDYKTGTGVVRAEDNKQLLFYTLCAAKDTKTAALLANVDKFVGVIVQPRVHGDLADIWEFDRATLDSFEVKVREAIAEAQSPQPKSKASTECKFCPYSPFCKDRLDYAAKAALLPPTERNTLAKSLPLALDLKQWCDEVIAAATDYAELGLPLRGHKLVRGRANRKWSDNSQAEAQLVQALGEEAYTKKILSPAQAIKLLRKAKQPTDSLDPLITVPLGKLTVVAESDPREVVEVENNIKKVDKLFDSKISS